VRQLRAPLLELLDTAPSTNLEEEVRRVSKIVPGVAGLEKCFIRKMGFKYYVDLHVVVDGRISATDGHRARGGSRHRGVAAENSQGAGSHRAYGGNPVLTGTA
jgi:divalent metal cation (Fe/Co/Zn/Cd) transporter